MSRILLAFLLLFPVACFSQNFIGKKKAVVIKELQKQVKKNDTLTITLTDNDSVVIYSVKEIKVLPADFIYGFDKEGRCESEKIITNCKECFEKLLQEALDRKKYEWKKINENQYVSKYSEQMMIELPGDKNKFYYTVLRTEWSKEMYNILTEN